MTAEVTGSRPFRRLPASRPRSFPASPPSSPSSPSFPRLFPIFPASSLIFPASSPSFLLASSLFFPPPPSFFLASSLFFHRLSLFSPRLFPFLLPLPYFSLICRFSWPFAACFPSPLLSRKACRRGRRERSRLPFGFLLRLAYICLIKNLRANLRPFSKGAKALSQRQIQPIPSSSLRLSAPTPGPDSRPQGENLSPAQRFISSSIPSLPFALSPPPPFALSPLSLSLYPLLPLSLYLLPPLPPL